MKSTLLLPALLLAVAAIAFAVPAAHAEISDEQLLVEQAHVTVNNFQTNDEFGWYRELLKEAEGVIIAPSMFKAGFLIGGSGGEAVLFARDENTREWLGPVFYNIGSVSGGLQVGAQIAEVVILVMTREGVEALYSPSVKLGTDVSVAVGPVGSGAEGATSHNPKAAFVSFMRAKGAYIGLTLEGSVIDVDMDANAVYYGRPVTPEHMLLKRSVYSEGGAALRKELTRNAAKEKE